MGFRVHPLAVALTIVFSGSAIAQTMPDDRGSLPIYNGGSVIVTGIRIVPTPKIDATAENQLVPMRATTSDTASLLKDTPGVFVQNAGGVSGLPSIHGLADDRLRIRVDGMDLMSACANHMNPPLSYIDPSNVEEIRVYAGLTPVSAGGDSLGGAILVDSKPPEFAAPGEKPLGNGEVGGFYRSNGDAWGANAAFTLATENLSLRYAGSTARSNNYRAARSFKPGMPAEYTTAGSHWIHGSEVGSSAYRSDNHQLSVAYRLDDHLFDLKLGYQHIPGQGFPNQHMDMTDNRSTQVNLGYTRSFDWGSLKVRAYHERTKHEMDFGEDKLFWYHASRTIPGMPMKTDGKNTGVTVNAEIQASDRDLIRVGAEYQRYRLDDRWPASYGIVGGAPVGGMQPDTFWNIHDGQRDRFDLYGEWEATWSPRWTTLLGMRAGSVRMNSGPVGGYNATYEADARRFNSRDRSRSDSNLDLAAVARFTPDAHQTYEGGYSRKTRSPSLYERYTWSTGMMAMTMNNWINDGNGYVGDVDLRPEVAHTISISGDWHDAADAAWNIKFTPYYSLVDNHIDSTCLATVCADGQYNYLTLRNQSARLYGADLSGHLALGGIESIGNFALRGMVSYINGKNRHTGDRLYNIMPLNARFTLEHRLGNWTTTIEEQLVGSKDRVSGVRNEMKTPGYALLNLRGSYEWKNLRFDIGLENALDKQYFLPLGGAYIGQGATMSLGNATDWTATGAAPWGYAVPGMGRSIYAGFNLKF
ncbi:MAG: TonB-dependent receptor plug domain-containing protein [Xanthomonadaceae bacterium]|jgi:iron complex outermembrane receptor protein|nr:TonB-dependent receptor plug domain-containing protein [Xanthomonadaceae bacterium]